MTPHATAPSQTDPRDTFADISEALVAALATPDPARLIAILGDVVEADILSQLNPVPLRAMRRLQWQTVEQFSILLARTIDLLRGHPLPDGLAAQAGKTALMLSGGGKLGNYHLGVLRTFHQLKLMPDIISGASAGALMAAVVGTRRGDELDKMIADGAQELSVDSHSGARELYFNPLSPDRMRDMVERLVPDWTFAEARAHSGRVIDIVVAESDSHGGGRVLNADTTPHVLLRDAVMASCAVPFLYPSVTLHQRIGDAAPTPFAGGARWIDGSIHADLPSDWLRDHYGATRLVASIVNPLELPFLTDRDSHGQIADSAMRSAMDMWRGIGATSLGLAASFVDSIPPMRRIFSLSRRVVEQRVDADIIIAPNQRVHALPQMVDHATSMEMEAFAAEGMRAAQARLDLIAPALRVERAIADHDSAVGKSDTH